jgi:hypothetical protein
LPIEAGQEIRAQLLEFSCPRSGALKTFTSGGPHEAWAN